MASAVTSDFNFEELVTPAELKILGAKEKGIFFTQDMVGEGEKKNSKDKKKLCVSNKRLYILNTQGKTPKLDLSLSLLAVSALNSPSPEAITLVYSTDPHSDKTKQTKLEVKSDFCVDSLAAILSPLHSSLGRDAVARRLKVKVQGEGRVERVDKIVDENVARVTQDSQSGAFSELYALLCDYLDVPFHDEIAWDLENTYQTHSLRALSLNDFSHFSTRDLVPLIRALEFSPRFEGLHADGIKLCPESTDAILHISKFCPNLRSLALRSVPALGYKIVQKLFLQGFAVNPRCVLESIDLTDTAVEDKGMEALAVALLSFPATPRELKLSGTGFSSKGFASLSKNLLKHSDAGTSLRTLDLCGNHFSTAADLQTFFSLLAAPNRLQELSLANSYASFDPLFAALHKGCLTHLSSLDLSGNSKPAVGKNQSKASSIKQFLQSCLSLKRLNLSACKLSPDLALQVLESLKENSSISDLHLNLSQNDLSSCLKDAAALLSGMHCVASLDLSQTGLDSDYSAVIAPILSNRSLRSLDLSGNMKRFKPAAAKALESSLSDLHCSLHSLKLKDCRLGDHANFVLRALIRNGALKQLDVSSNQMGPSSFRQLAKLINNNCSLDSLLYDDNNASVGCISGLASALENNFSINEMPIPYRDMPRLRKEGDKDLEAALSKISRLLARNQSPLRSEHALAVIRKRVQLFLAEQQLSLDKKIVQLEEEAQLYDRALLDEGRREVLDRASNLAAKAGLVTALCENFYSDKLEAGTRSQLSELVSNLSDQSLVPGVSSLRKKVVDEMLDKLEFSLGSAVSKERLEEIRTDVSGLRPPEFLTQELLSVFSGGLASGVNAGNLVVAEQLIARTCDLVSSDLDALYQQVYKLESAETPKSPDRLAAGGTCRMRLAFSQSMKRHRVSYQTYSPQLDDAGSEDLDEAHGEREVAGEIELPVPAILETKPSVEVKDDAPAPPVDCEELPPDSGEPTPSKSSSIRSKFKGLSKKIKPGTKVTRTGSSSSNSSLKAEVDQVPDLTAFEDLSSTASRAPELNLLKSKPRGPIRRPPRREPREATTEAPPSDIFAEIAATVVPGLDQEAPPADESAALGSESKDLLNTEALTSPDERQEGGEEGAEKKQPPPPSPRKPPSGQTTPGPLPGNPGLASVLMAGLGKSKVKASKSHENLIAAAEKEELQQKMSLDSTLAKDPTHPAVTRPKPRQRPMSVFKPVLLGSPADPAKEEGEKLPPIATKRHTMEDKTTKSEIATEGVKAVSSSDENRAKEADTKEDESKPEKKEDKSGENLPVAKPAPAGVDGDIKKSPSISRKPMLPKPKDKPAVDAKAKEAAAEGGESELKRPPVAANRPKPTTIKPQKPLLPKAKPKLDQESPEKLPAENTEASHAPDKTKASGSQSEEERDGTQAKKPDSLESSSEQTDPHTTHPLADSSDTSTTSSDIFEDASDRSPGRLNERSFSAPATNKPACSVKPGPQTPTKPKRMSFGKSPSSDEMAELPSPKVKSPLATKMTSPNANFPTPAKSADPPTVATTASDLKGIQQAPEDAPALKPKPKPEPAAESKERDSWVVISDEDAEKAESTDKKNDTKTDETAPSDS